MTSEFQMTMDEYLPLRDVVFQTLRKAILRGELKPGERLMEIALANKLGVSYGYLSTIFVKNTGKSFKTCLVEVRMEAARELLISIKYKIYEIADMVGYSSPRYFTDAFKKFFGISPLDYIARLRGES